MTADVPGPIVTIGEAMAVLSPLAADAHTFAASVGGAEFNVAASLGRLGVPTAWVSRVGDDGFGTSILQQAIACSVDTGGVEVDPTRATGLYVKETTRDGDVPRSTMRYYRAGSAASAMGSEFFTSSPVHALLHSARIVHVSGITPALSTTTAESMAGLRGHLMRSAVLSVDLNLRPALWAGRDRSALDTLVAQADLLFAGTDEARAHFGHAEPGRLFGEHPQLQTIVLKDDDRMACAYLRTRPGIQSISVPALRVSVVEPIGAGDAFAAGYLAAMADGRSQTQRLRMAHALAALALISTGDRPESVPDARAREVITSSPDWDSWAVASGSVPWELS